MRYYKTLILISAILVSSCTAKNNVIRGSVTFHDNTTMQDKTAEGAAVYLYKSIVVRQDHPHSFMKETTVGTAGYYSFFSLSSGPYYIYSEKLDSNGKIIYATGVSTNVSGDETKVLNLNLH
jgi:hypothetical protein